MRPIARCLAASLVLAAGCPVYTIRPAPQPAPTVRPTPGPPTAPVPPAPRLVQVHIINSTNQVVCYLHISPASDTQWGEDRLGSQTLPHGAALRVQLDARYPAWDLLAKTCDGATLVEMRNFALPADGNIYLRPPAAPPPPPPVEVPPQPVQVRLVNDSDVEIWYLYVSEAGAPWGEDRLGPSQTIPPGEEVILELDANLLWDYKAEDRNHQPITEQHNVRVFEGAVWSVRNTPGAPADG